MSIFDDLGQVLSGGAATVGRTMNTARLQRQLDELAESRRDLAAQLGENMLQHVKDDPDLYKVNKEIIDVMDRIENQRQAILSEIAAAEMRAAQAVEAATIYECPKCGRSVPGTHSFCSGCGTPIALIKEAMEEAGAAVAGKEAIKCPQCGAHLNEGDVYCMDCGARVE